MFIELYHLGRSRWAESVRWSKNELVRVCVCVCVCVCCLSVRPPIKAGPDRIGFVVMPCPSVSQTGPDCLSGYQMSVRLHMLFIKLIDVVHAFWLSFVFGPGCSRWRLLQQDMHDMNGGSGAVKR